MDWLTTLLTATNVPCAAECGHDRGGYPLRRRDDRRMSSAGRSSMVSTWTIGRDQHVALEHGTVIQEGDHLVGARAPRPPRRAPPGRSRRSRRRSHEPPYAQASGRSPQPDAGINRTYVRRWLGDVLDLRAAGLAAAGTAAGSAGLGGHRDGVPLRLLPARLPGLSGAAPAPGRAGPVRRPVRRRAVPRGPGGTGGRPDEPGRIRPADVLESAVEAWLEQEAMLARTRRAVLLVEEALRGRVFVRKL